MAFNYDIEDNPALPRNQIRFLLQDTDADDHFLEDEEIEVVLGAEYDIYKAAARLCRTIAMRLLKQAGYKDFAVQYDPDAKAKQYRELAAEFDKLSETRVGSRMSFPVGTIYDQNKTDDRPAFTRNLHMIK